MRSLSSDRKAQPELGFCIPRIQGGRLIELIGKSGEEIRINSPDWTHRTYPGYAPVM
jgi:hypothetical protein